VLHLGDVRTEPPVDSRAPGAQENTYVV